LGRQKSPSTIQPGQQLNKPFCCHLILSPFIFSELDIMMRNVDYLLVLYHDRKKRSQKGCMTYQPQNSQRWNIQPRNVWDLKKRGFKQLGL
jgi:hypothetical protein